MDNENLMATRAAYVGGGGQEPNNHEIFPLNEAAIATVAELRENIRAAQLAINAVLSYFVRQHELKGRVQLSENGRELIIHTTPVRQGEPR